jgi:hypothetical protein
MRVRCRYRCCSSCVGGGRFRRMRGLRGSRVGQTLTGGRCEERIGRLVHVVRAVRAVDSRFPTMRRLPRSTSRLDARRGHR